MVDDSDNQRGAMTDPPNVNYHGGLSPIILIGTELQWYKRWDGSKSMSNEVSCQLS